MREVYTAFGLATVLIGAVFLLPTSYGPPPRHQPVSVQPAATPSQLTAPSAQTAPAAQVAPPTAPTTATAPAAPMSHGSTGSPAPTVTQASTGPSVSGDAAAGRQVYRKCQACHSLEAGKNSVGPSMANIVGKKAASDPSYNYSQALRAANLTWDLKTLDAYLLDPQKLVPGNKMPFPGLKTDSERQSLLAFLAASSGGTQTAQRAAPPAGQAPQAAPAPQQGAAPSGSASYIGDARFTLRTGIAEGRMVFIGVGGAIDGQINPTLTALEGQMVQVILVNGEGAEHDIIFPTQDARSQRITGRGSSTSMSFRSGGSGEYIYFCDIPGHRQAGMEGKFVVAPAAAASNVAEADISHDPSDLPPPIGKRAPQTIKVELETIELEARLADGATFGFWTFNGKVPGPFLRVRVGDTVDVTLKNAHESTLIHSVDFHAATGPGGGAASTQTDPGQQKSVKWKALVPGIYVYHCATPMVAHHIANGMYGLILVEPEEGLPPVDREFYVMQGEIYTEAAHGGRGSQDFSVEKLLNERPEYFVFNGSVGALTKLHPLKAKVGETVRIFFGVGGPNFTSSFHVIGEIFDRVYNMGDVINPPMRGVQTITVPAGGAAITEFKLDYPGNYILVDHALSRAERGLVGILQVEGPRNPEIYDGHVESGSH